MFEVKVITEPTELITAAMVKTHCKIDSADENDYIEDYLIPTGRKVIENYCGISIGEQERRLTADLGGFVETELPNGPTASVDEVEYKVEFGEYDRATVNDDYDVDGDDFKTFTPVFGGRWKVTYTCGYETIPADLKQAILCQIAHMWEHRGDTSISQEAKRLAQPYLRNFGI